MTHVDPSDAEMLSKAIIENCDNSQMSFTSDDITSVFSCLRTADVGIVRPLFEFFSSAISKSSDCFNAQQTFRCVHSLNTLKRGDLLLDCTLERIAVKITLAANPLAEISDIWTLIESCPDKGAETLNRLVSVINCTFLLCESNFSECIRHDAQLTAHAPSLALHFTKADFASCILECTRKLVGVQLSPSPFLASSQAVEVESSICGMLGALHRFRDFLDTDGLIALFSLPSDSQYSVAVQSLQNFSLHKLSSSSLSPTQIQSLAAQATTHPALGRCVLSAVTRESKKATPMACSDVAALMGCLQYLHKSYDVSTLLSNLLRIDARDSFSVAEAVTVLQSLQRISCQSDKLHVILGDWLMGLQRRTSLTASDAAPRLRLLLEARASIAIIHSNGVGTAPFQNSVLASIVQECYAHRNNSEASSILDTLEAWTCFPLLSAQSTDIAHLLRHKISKGCLLSSQQYARCFHLLRNASHAKDSSRIIVKSLIEKLNGCKSIHVDDALQILQGLHAYMASIQDQNELKSTFMACENIFLPNRVDTRHSKSTICNMLLAMPFLMFVPTVYENNSCNLVAQLSQWLESNIGSVNTNVDASRLSPLLSDAIYALQNLNCFIPGVPSILVGYADLLDRCTVAMDPSQFARSVAGLCGLSSDVHEVRQLIRSLVSLQHRRKKEEVMHMSNDSFNLALSGLVGLNSSSSEVRDLLEVLISFYNSNDLKPGRNFNQAVRGLQGLNSKDPFVDDFIDCIVSRAFAAGFQRSQHCMSSLLYGLQGVSYSASPSLFESIFRSISKRNVSHSLLLSLLLACSPEQLRRRGFPSHIITKAMELSNLDFIAQRSPNIYEGVAATNSKVESIVFQAAKSVFGSEFSVTSSAMLFGFEADVVLRIALAGLPVVINLEVDGPTHRTPKSQRFCKLRDNYLFSVHKVIVVRWDICSADIAKSQSIIVDRLQKIQTAILSQIEA